MESQWFRILKPFVAEGKVLSRKNDEAVISLGIDDGVHPGDRLDVQSEMIVFNTTSMPNLPRETDIRRRI